MIGWKDLFRTHILERGLDYFERGALDSLEKTEEGYRAVVQGSEPYQVKIVIQDDRVYDMSCDCPYAEDGNYCKHMAAVLYEIEKESGETSDSSNSLNRILENRKELETVIGKIPEKELRQLLIGLAWEDESLRNRILTTYSETIDAGQMMRLKREVDGIAYQYSDRHGFVDYYHASDYADAMDTFLRESVQALVDKECLMQAFELTNYVFHCVGNQDMDDSGGEISWIADTCYEFWKTILQKCNEKEKNQMFQWFQNHQQGYVVDYMEDYMADFVMNEFHDPEMLKQKLKALDELIVKAGSHTDCGQSYFAHYGYENNIIKRIQIMRELGCSDGEIVEYREKFRQFSAIRKLEIQDFLDKKQYNSAIKTLKESKELDREYPGLVSEYSKSLIDIYAKTGQKREYRSELEYQIFHCSQRDLQFIELLKAACGKEEWIQYREKILESNTAWSIKYEFLESEGLYERLLCEIKNGNSIYVLDQYERTLKKRYPEAVRDAYIAFIERRAESVADRKNYREIVKYLKKIAAYPGGKNKARDVAGKWRVVYKRRPAMMDELRKAGF